MDPSLMELLESTVQHRDVQTLASKTLPRIVRYVGADNGSLMLLAGERVIHKVLANKETFTEVSEHKVRTVLAEGLAGWALRHRQGALASNTALDERWVSMGDTSIGSALVVPLMIRGGAVGLLSLHHPEPGHLRELHLAKAAELAQLLAVPFEMALMIESAMAALATQCRCAANPSVVLDWDGNVRVVNAAMQALDIAWEGVNYAQTLLPRELGAASVAECDWDGVRPLVTQPFGAHAIPFRGAGVWIELVDRTV